MSKIDRLFIGNEWVKPSGAGLIDVISPTTEELVARVADSTPEDMDRAVKGARAAFDGDWPAMSVDERGAYLLRLADLFESRLAQAVDAQIEEMGGTKTFLSNWTFGAAAMIRHDVELAKTLAIEEHRKGMMGNILVRREPVGVVGAIIPWNCPVLFLITKMLPALLSGCPIIIKPAQDSPYSAYVVAEAIEAAGFPRGLISIVAGGREVGEYLVSHPGIDKVSFTGSTAAGRRIGAICGEQIKPCTLELGGKSAAIILDDADLDALLPSIIHSSMLNTGQACVSTTRVLAPAARYDEVVERLAAAVGELKLGDPHEDDTFFGPLAGARHRDRVEQYLRLGVEEGAIAVQGGGRPANLPKGWYVEPTIFANVTNDMRIAREEIFGPVVSVIKHEGDEDAIRIANDSPYGLGGGVYTADIERGLGIARRVRTGTFSINDGPIGGGGGPTGGYKQSGLGREFNIEGLAHHYQLKSVTFPQGLGELPALAV